MGCAQSPEVPLYPAPEVPEENEGQGPDDDAEDASVPSFPPLPDASTEVEPEPSEPAPTTPPPPTGDDLSPVLYTKGKQILDTCGEPFIARGLEQFSAPVFSADNTFVGIARELIKTGSNAVRILPSIDELSMADLDAMLAAFAVERVVVYISPGDRSWFSRSDVRQVLMRHEKGLVLDAFQEPDYWDVPRWVRDTKASITQLRGQGYTCPLTVLADGYGRNLPAALEHGQEIVDSDPLHNIIVGWQAYWGTGGYYQAHYGMSLTEGVKSTANVGFPMQIGIDEFADPGERMDFKSVMAATQTHGIGWLWWDWWNKFGNTNSLSRDGTYANLTETGKVVITSDPNSIANTAKKACFR